MPLSLGVCMQSNQGYAARLPIENKAGAQKSVLLGALQN
jgi:hypothetical protein